MSVRKLRLATASTAVFVLLGAFEPARWKYRSAVAIPSGAELLSIRLTRAIYSRSAPGLPDLRIVCDTSEVPYVLEARTGSVEEHERNAEIINKEVAPGAGLRLTLDLGVASKHSRIRLRTPERNFRELVRIETSDDNRSWAIVRDDASIFRFYQDGRSADLLTVDYPVSTRRYVRVSVPGWNESGSISGVFVAFREVRLPELEVMASLNPKAIEEPNTKSTRYEMDLGVEGLPHDRLRVETGESFYHRAVELETSTYGKKWSRLGSGVLYRLPGDSADSITFPETHDRYLRLRVFNEDNRPIQLGLVHVATVVRYVTFQAETELPHWLFYGNPEADRPLYDLGMILARRSVEPVQVAARAPESNPNYQPLPEPGKPWTDRYPALLYTILGAAVLAMGYVTVRFLRKVMASSQDS